MDTILYRARQLDPTVVREIERLGREVPDKEIWVVSYAAGRNPVTETRSSGRHLVYTRRDVSTLPYPDLLRRIDWATMTGHHDLPVMKFFLEQKRFDRYWIIEDDVRYSGNWSQLFAELDQSAADLLATTLYPRRLSRGWPWWTSLKCPEGQRLADEDCHRSFGPMARLSHRLLAELDARYRAGWDGHFELTWPTFCHLARYAMEDIGGYGPFVPASRRGRYYYNDVDQWSLFPGTFVYRPSFHDADILRCGRQLTGSDMLWHPVKV